MIRKMKNVPVKMQRLLGVIAAFVIFSAMPFISLAQPTGFEIDSSGHGGGGDLTDVPLDGGTVFLIAAGVLFGAYKLYKMAQLKATTSTVSC